MLKLFLVAIGAAILSAALMGCGSTPYDLVMSDRQRAEAEKACTGAGFRPGTNQFARCLQDRSVTRTHITPDDNVSPR
jgi:hypothetical protein